jgi:hypothetical protein
MRHDGYPDHGDTGSNYHTKTQQEVFFFCYWCLVTNPTFVLQWQVGRALIGFDWFSGQFCLYVTAMMMRAFVP